MSETHRALQHLTPSEGKSLRVGRFDLLFKAGAAVGSSYAVVEMTIPAGAALTLHRHPWEETMYVLEGDLELVGEHGDRLRTGPGYTMNVPSRAAHGFRNAGAIAARVLLIGPAAHEAYFDDMSRAMAGAADDPGAVAAARARHGVENCIGPVAGGK